MAPGASVLDAQANVEASPAKAAELAAARPTNILHRTPWKLPVAKSANGIYFELEDGRKVIDGVGGAAVNCIGNGNQDVVKAMSEQVAKMACESRCCCLESVRNDSDSQHKACYNMQLSNEPAEDLAKYLVASSNGAFSLCGFVSGGMFEILYSIG
jgi:acetylornithine/succinyldiaminopimelate/putrescine aminotransferase